MQRNTTHTRSDRALAATAMAAAIATLALTACGQHDSQDATNLVGGTPTTSVSATPAAATQQPPVVSDAPLASSLQQPAPPQPVATVPTYQAPTYQAPTYQAPTYVPPARVAQTRINNARPAPTEAPAQERRIVADRNTIGSVESIEPIRDRPQGSGAGAVIGGVLGAVVGNQFGHSAGRAAMTGLGAVGGAVAGNNLERNHREGVTGYRVSIRLDNGSTRSYERTDVANLQVGDRVHLDANSFHRV